MGRRRVVFSDRAIEREPLGAADNEEEEDEFTVDDDMQKKKRLKKRRKNAEYVRDEDNDVLPEDTAEENLMGCLLLDAHLEDEDRDLDDEDKMARRNYEILRQPVPERKQISDESIRVLFVKEKKWIRKPLAGGVDFVKEEKWIRQQLAGGSTLLFEMMDAPENLPLTTKDILRFLHLVHEKNFDIPFIAMHQKDEVMSLLRHYGRQKGDEEGDGIEKKPSLKWHKVLWTIFDLDRKWLLLQTRKGALYSNYTSLRVDDKEELALEKQILNSIAHALGDAKTESEVDDVESKFSLHFPAGEVGLDDGMSYSICSNAGLWMVASNFGYSSEQFGLLISVGKSSTCELEDARETPEAIASNFTSAMFGTPQAVLAGARHMAAIEISCEPCVRRYIRSIFMDNAAVSTRPTINTFHQLAGVKWLQDKPLRKFEDAQWLIIQKAEEENLLQVSIKLPEHSQKKLVNDCKKNYLSNGVSKTAQLWNEQRQLILDDALLGFLLPSMEKEARSWLTSRAKNWLLMEYGEALWNKVSVGPYQRKGNSLCSDDRAAPTVMACCWDAGRVSTTFVMLDSAGEVLDVLYAGPLTGRFKNDSDALRVLKFMTDLKPHVVVLGAADVSCTHLKDALYEIISKMGKENPSDVGDEAKGLSIVYGDESLPRLYENSQISTDQLRGQPGIVRRAVGLGRYLQNPLAMVATLSGSGREILSWKLHSLQDFLTPDEKYSVVEQVMVEITNQVGLDVNLAICHEWMFAPLQFISGLGPLKAVYLQRSLVSAGALDSETSYLFDAARPVGGLIIFNNAIGFLHLRRSGSAARGHSNLLFRPLDESRIHPFHHQLAYELAETVCLRNLDMTKSDREQMERERMAVELVMKHPEWLRGFDVHEFAAAKMLENKIQTLYDIKRELLHGYQDWRKPYEEPSQDEEFLMFCGETEEALLAEGRILQATVRHVEPQRAICSLKSSSTGVLMWEDFKPGLTGVLMREDYCDDWRDMAELSTRLHEGDTVTCKIKSVDKNNYQVFLVKLR